MNDLLKWAWLKSSLGILEWLLLRLEKNAGNNKSNSKSNNNGVPTGYPIVLTHGFGGFDSIMGISYFKGVKEHLENHGFEVYEVETSPYANLQTRANQLAEQVDQILEKAYRRRGHPVKLNLIAHSMGGLDCRLLISNNTTGETTSDDSRDSVRGFGYADKVNSLTTVGSPHWGVRIADRFLSDIPGHAQEAWATILNLAGSIYNDTSPNENDLRRATYYLTEKFCTQFNIDHPEPEPKGVEAGEREGIIYRTFAGITKEILPLPPKPDVDEVDEVDLPLWLTYKILASDPIGENHINDGFVPFFSAVWKPEYYLAYQGDALPADHLNQVGYSCGMGIDDQKFDHLDFYLHLANLVNRQREEEESHE